MDRLRELQFRFRGSIAFALTLVFFISSRNTWSTWGLVFLFVSVALRVWSRTYISKHTRSDTIEAPFLITSGPYSISKNPLYISNLLFVIAILCGQSLVVFSFWLFLFGVHFHFLALSEKSFLKKKYPEYITWKSPMWLGFFSWSKGSPDTSWKQAFTEDTWTWIWQALIVVVCKFI